MKLPESMDSNSLLAQAVVMSELKERLLRSVRANLNHLLDNVQRFEERGGFRSIFDDQGQAQGEWEEIGRGRDPYEHSPPPAMRGSRKTIEDYYANLEVPFGSDLDTVKAAYRRLMRKYHPDNFASDAEKEATATRLSQELSVAYQAIQEYLRTGRY